MFSERAFFSFVDLSAESSHRAYNEWHQLDHRPENLRLPGVAWGDRWARTAACAEAGEDNSADFAGTDYVAMYWFRPPYDESVAAWTKLGEDSHQWGRGPRLPGVRRPLTAFFTPVKGYVAPRVLVSADTLPFRPNRGLHVSVSRFRDHHGAAAHDHFTWQDRVRIPDLLGVDGVAGAWTFSFLATQRHPTLAFNDSEDYALGELRIQLLYLDADPVQVSAEIAEHERAWDAAGRGAPQLTTQPTTQSTAQSTAEERLLSSPVSTIIPWQDW